MRLIDADALERDGWQMSRTVQVSKDTMEYQVRKPKDFPAIEDATTIEPKVDQSNKELEEARAHIHYLLDRMSRDSGMIEGLKYAIRYHKVGGDDL